jgi:hypothetical protein
MQLFVEQVDTWAASVPDRPGALAAILGTLQEAGVSPLSVVSHREHGNEGHAVVFVSPIEGDHEIRAASQLGFNLAQSVHGVRVVATSVPGLAAMLTQRVADAGINLRGFTSTVLGRQFVAYFALDSEADAGQVAQILGRQPLPRAA